MRRRIAVAAKNIARQLRDRFPIDANRRTEPVQAEPAKPQLPVATLDLVELMVAFLAFARPDSIYVQIGAGDGYHGDVGVRDLLPLGKLRAFLVEPLPESFEKLQQRYLDVPNVRVIQAAIGVSDGEVELFRARNEGRWLDSTAAPQFTSFRRDHLIRHGIAEDEICSISVRALTLASLFDSFGIDRVDLLKVDTEGFDAAVVDMALALPARPACIYFEHLHLQTSDRGRLYEDLSASGYVFAHDKWNTLAVNVELTLDWRRS